MGFQNTKDEEVNGIKDFFKKQLTLTRCRLLIGVKIVGYLILLLIIYNAYQKWQINPLFINHRKTDDISINTNNKNFYFKSIESLNKFMNVRNSNSYQLKKDFVVNYRDSLIDKELKKLVIS